MKCLLHWIYIQTVQSVIITYESSDYFNLKIDMEANHNSSSIQYVAKYQTNFAVPINIANGSSKHNIFVVWKMVVIISPQ